MIKALIKLMRLPNDLMIGSAVIIGEIIACGSFKIPLISSVFGFLTGFLIASSIMVFNDIFDLEIDRINNPNRPLPKGELSIKSAVIFGCLLFILGIISAFLTSIYHLLIAVVFWFLGIMYNYKLKKLGLIGNIIVSASVAIPFIYGYMIITPYLSLLIVVFALAAFLSNLSREVLKGIIDLKGDSLKNIKTVARVYGIKKAYFTSVSLIILSVAIALTPLIPPLYDVMHLRNILGYGICVFVSSAIFITALLYPFFGFYRGNPPSRELLIKIKNIMLIAMSIGMIGFLLGSISM